MLCTYSEAVDPTITSKQYPDFDVVSSLCCQEGQPDKKHVLKHARERSLNKLAEMTNRMKRQASRKV